MKRVKILFAALTALIMVAGLCGFTTASGLGTISSENTRDIGPGVSYTSVIANNSTSGGIVSARVIDADIKSGKAEAYVYEGEVRKTYNLTKMTSNIAAEGYSVIAGINGDIYDTSTGTPKGAVIHNGILYTGGYDTNYLLSIDKEGNAAVTKQSIYYSMQYKKQVENEDGTTSTVDANIGISYFNVPHGGSNALHVFNNKYSSTTRTTGTCAEVVLQVKNGGSADLKIGGTVEATVVSVNPATKSTPIAAGQLVLSANSSSASYSALCQMVPGTDVRLSVALSENTALAKADEAMGVYNILAYNGQIWTTDKTKNPRTCIGIKADGNLILFVVDGRQSGVSLGMNAVDVANYLMSLGCVTVVNMDGGGSTTMVARDDPGRDDSAGLVNSPSDGSMRSVTNGLFIVSGKNGGSETTHLELYPEKTMIMPGCSVKVAAYGVNSLYEKTELTEPVTWSTDYSDSSISAGGLFKTSKSTPAGTAVVKAQSGTADGSTEIEVVTEITFGVSKSSLSLKPGQSYDINITNVKHGYSTVLYDDSFFTFSCPSDLGTIDERGVFTASSDKTDKSGNITVKYGSRTVTIPVTIKYTYSGPFKDVASHWARDYITELYEQGIVSGMTADTFQPDGKLTRAQFLTLLYKLDGGQGGSAGATDPGFTDVKPGSWYYDYVKWGVQCGIVSGMGDGSFAPDSQVSREQICVMLCNYYSYRGLAYSGQPAALTFKDSGSISSWALAAVQKIAGEGIMSGRTDGSFDPQGSATRGEASKIIYMMDQVVD